MEGNEDQGAGGQCGHAPLLSFQGLVQALQGRGSEGGVQSSGTFMNLCSYTWLKTHPALTSEGMTPGPALRCTARCGVTPGTWPTS